MIATRRIYKQGLIDGKYYTVEVARTGRFRSSDGSGFYVLTEQNIDELVEYANNAQQPITIDYNHATFLNSPTPEQTIAAGYHHNWGWEKRRNDDGTVSLLAVKNTEWTPRAKEFINSGEYRFISSVLMFDGRNGEMRTGAKIIGSSLVPIPNIKGMDAVMLNAKQIAFKAFELNQDSSVSFEVNFNNSTLLPMQGTEKMNAYLNELKAVMEDMVGDTLTEENGAAFIEKAKSFVGKYKKHEAEKNMAEKNAATLAKEKVDLMAQNSTLVAELNAAKNAKAMEAAKSATIFEETAANLLAEIALNAGKITPAQFNGEKTVVEVNGEKKEIVAMHPIRPIFRGNLAIALQELNGDAVKAMEKAIVDTKAYINAMPSVLPSGAGTVPNTAPPKSESIGKYGDGKVEVNSESTKVAAEIAKLQESGKTFEQAINILRSKYPEFLGE